MRSRWSEPEAERYLREHAQAGAALAQTAYLTRLLGADPDLALPGGGNTSCKLVILDRLGEAREALYVKASGVSMDQITPEGFVCLDLSPLRKLGALGALLDPEMADEFRVRLLRPHPALPSVETLTHAFLAPPCVAHTHPAAILAITNRADGPALLQEIFGESVGIVPYADAGLALGQAVAAAAERQKDLRGVIVLHHGLFCWGETPRQAYQQTIALVSLAEEALERKKSRRLTSTQSVDEPTARARYLALAPALRGALSPATGDPDRPHQQVVLAPLLAPEITDLINSAQARELLLTSPLTPDYLVRTKALPLWLDQPRLDDPAAFKTQLGQAIAAYSAEIEAFRKRHAAKFPGHDTSLADLLPKLILIPGLGAVAVGPDLAGAALVRDITRQGISVKRAIWETGGHYLGLPEDHLFDMEFRGFQRAKVERGPALPLKGSVALVTGAAGAIGLGICEALLAAGAHLLVTDLPGEALDTAVRELGKAYPGRVVGAPLDVTDPASVAAAFSLAVLFFGGLDIVIANAGIAHVAPLVQLDLAQFQKIERVNVEGTLLTLAEAGRLFARQGIGGDVVLISTKNVFAPGAKFGAYSATKAAAHQLARIASLEFAEVGVRVNMVSPDAVFSHGARKSGLWAQVGPDRMKARGLTEQGLADYYQGRNLLKARVTAEHVARAVLFFVTRQTPTTGATLPVDGGLPDSTPR